ncbi:hypothetical protein E2C01_035585 [Portunus trituberculatus]|uniref:Uncharacterized protein n=1 Tax=Portunus trituberculatus TaxID=210409 RepID=A0A5B7FBW2_PORTR|nr:hypothetical protein [Portunus trituberculatus]
MVMERRVSREGGEGEPSGVVYVQGDHSEATPVWRCLCNERHTITAITTTATTITQHEALKSPSPLLTPDMTTITTTAILLHSLLPLCITPHKAPPPTSPPPTL